jgi:hypothetical protein
MLKENLELIQSVFAQLGIEYTEPYATTEGAINRSETGQHRGLYYIYPEVNFYFGKAATNTVVNRHKTHRPKLDVDLAALYSTPKEKKEPKWIFPEGWKEAVRRYIIEDTGPIPSHFVKTGRGTVVPGVLEHPVTHLIDVDTLPVLVWDLEHLTAQQISQIEEHVIEAIWPYANDETYRRRLRERAATELNNPRGVEDV